MPAGGKVIDILGVRFGRLVAERFLGIENHAAIWECRCDCGNMTTAKTRYLRYGRKRSCGCLHIDTASGVNRRHGMHGTPTYKSWSSMIQRCTNSNHDDFHNYGGRGITVLDRWLSFDAFHKDMGTRPPVGYSIDRIDVNGNYGPGNCRWATTKEQQSNKRNSLIVEAHGMAMGVAEWSALTGVSEAAMRARLDRGTPPERSMFPGLLWHCPVNWTPVASGDCEGDLVMEVQAA